MSRGRLLAALLLVAVGASIALGPLSPTVVVDGTGDWRQVCLGCRRGGGAGDALVVAREALVHLHGLDGRQQSLELSLSARQQSVELDVAASHAGAPLLTARIGPAPERLRVPLAGAERQLDLWLHARASKGLPLRLHRVVLARSASPFDRLVQWLPLLGGLTAFLLLLRRPLPLALLLAVVVMACTALAAFALHDPLGLLELRPGRQRLAQTALVAVLACGALWRPPGRRLALATLAATSWLLFLPTARSGLVSDDFLWARRWTLSDVASTFVGPEDPSGKSNVYYRPIPSTVHAVDSWVWGDFVAGYHLTNMLLHPLAGAAALLLLERLGLGRRAALAGALAWAVHPMSASAVSWVSQRTDLLVSCFYLSALLLLLSPLGRRIWPPLVAATLALGSKELAISLPAVAGVSVWLFLPPAERRSRVAALLALCLLAVAHVTWWVYLFPEVAGGRVFGGGPAPPPGDASPGLLRGLAEAMASVAWPVGYEKWWKMRLDPLSPATLLACAAIPLVALWLRRCSACGRRSAGAAAAFSVVWVPLVSLPLFGIRLVDLYRLGFMPAFAFALAAAAVFAHLEHGGAWRPVPLFGVLVAWLAPLALGTAAQWGPGGFYYEMSLTLERRLGGQWVTGLSPLALDLYTHQLAASDHVLAAGERLDLGSAADDER